MEVHEADGVGAGLAVDEDADDAVGAEEEGGVVVLVHELDFGRGEGFDERFGDGTDGVLGLSGGDELFARDGEVGEVEVVGVEMLAVADGGTEPGLPHRDEDDDSGEEGEDRGKEEDPAAGGEGEEAGGGVGRRDFWWVLHGAYGSGMRGVWGG